ncbi:zinc ribbon domain-containing protein [Rhodococcus opacus]|uniref:zinc ribbon domain-containing protein n=1 Tax=Rhodococcus opacus TaxID=37919 RepID=UPI003D7947CD
MGRLGSGSPRGANLEARYPCGHVDKANRITQDRFVCRVCGHVDQADHNAALNIAYLGYVKYMTTTHGYWAA